MILVAGLGNYEKQYLDTRHNMGFRVLDRLSDILSFSFDRSGFKSDYALVKDDRLIDDVIFLRPLTMMNLSGDAVRAAADFYKSSTEDILVIYDEMALPPGHIRLRKQGSDAGHKGIGDIIRKMGTQDIKRIKIGIGEPPFDPVSFVLGKPTKEEAPLIDGAIEEAARATIDFLREGFEHAMNHYNKR